MSDAPTLDAAVSPASRGRLGSYALWQMRDYLINKGIATALISGLMLFLAWSALQAATSMAGGGRGEGSIAMFLEMSFIEFMSNIVLFGVLFATNGIVSEDRKLGYYRFYFTKPVSVAAFYAQKFFVHVLGVLVMAALMLGVHSIVIEPRFPAAYFPVIAMTVIGLAGIGFLISALFTLDWMSLFAIYAASQIGWTLYEDDAGVRGTLIRALPPVHRLREVYTAVARGEPVPSEPLWWIFIYGAVCFVLALVVIARRRLATN